MSWTLATDKCLPPPQSAPHGLCVWILFQKSPLSPGLANRVLVPEPPGLYVPLLQVSDKLWLLPIVSTITLNKCVLNLHWMLQELVTLLYAEPLSMETPDQATREVVRCSNGNLSTASSGIAWFYLLYYLYWSHDNFNVFYSRGEILVRDSNRSDWIYIVKSVSTKTQRAQPNQLHISNTTTDIALCIAIHNWFINWFKRLNRPISIILYAKHGIIPLSLPKLDFVLILVVDKSNHAMAINDGLRKHKLYHFGLIGKNFH